jgi:hypothetical protein
VIQGPSPTGSPFGLPPAPGAGVPEIVIGAVLVLIGLWSMVKWMRTEFAAESMRDRVLYVAHVTSRVGLWFGFAAFFFGLALVDEPSGFTWFLVVPLALAGVQLITGVALGQGHGRGNGSVR